MKNMNFVLSLVVMLGAFVANASQDCPDVRNYRSSRGCVYNVPAATSGSSISKLANINLEEGFDGVVAGICSSGQWLPTSENCRAVPVLRCGSMNLQVITSTQYGVLPQHLENNYCSDGSAPKNLTLFSYTRLLWECGTKSVKCEAAFNFESGGTR
jgi:hypothetical protein